MGHSLHAMYWIEWIHYFAIDHWIPLLSSNMTVRQKRIDATPNVVSYPNWRSLGREELFPADVPVNSLHFRMRHTCWVATGVAVGALIILRIVWCYITFLPVSKANFPIRRFRFSCSLLTLWILETWNLITCSLPVCLVEGLLCDIAIGWHR